MGGMSSTHPTHFFTCAFLWRMIRVVGRASGVRTKVLSKDEWVKDLLSIPCRGVVDYVVVAHRVRLLVMFIVACRSRLVLTLSGGARVKQKRGGSWSREVQMDSFAQKGDEEHYSAQSAFLLIK